MIDDNTPEAAERYGNPFVLSGEPVRSALFVPLVVGGRATGVVSLQNLDRTHAFTEGDQGLLTTLASSPVAWPSTTPASCTRQGSGTQSWR